MHGRPARPHPQASPRGRPAQRPQRAGRGHAGAPLAALLPTRQPSRRSRPRDGPARGLRRPAGRLLQSTRRGGGTPRRLAGAEFTRRPRRGRERGDRPLGSGRKPPPCRWTGLPRRSMWVALVDDHPPPPSWAGTPAPPATDAERKTRASSMADRATPASPRPLRGLLDRVPGALRHRARGGRPRGPEPVPRGRRLCAATAGCTSGSRRSRSSRRRAGRRGREGPRRPPRGRLGHGQRRTRGGRGRPRRRRVR